MRIILSVLLLYIINTLIRKKEARYLYRVDLRVLGGCFKYVAKSHPAFSSSGRKMVQPIMDSVRHDALMAIRSEVEIESYDSF